MSHMPTKPGAPLLSVTKAAMRGTLQGAMAKPPMPLTCSRFSAPAGRVDLGWALHACFSRARQLELSFSGLKRGDEGLNARGSSSSA